MVERFDLHLHQVHIFNFSPVVQASQMYIFILRLCNYQTYLHFLQVIAKRNFDIDVLQEIGLVHYLRIFNHFFEK